jgi:hypothetical protein
MKYYKELKYKETNVFLILDETTLEIVKGDDNQALKFSTQDEANEFASGRLDVWDVINSCFIHRRVQHIPNM